MAESEASEVKVFDAIEAVHEFAASFNELKTTAWERNVADTDKGQAMLKLGEREQIAVIVATLSESKKVAKNRDQQRLVDKLRGQLARRKLPYTVSDITAIAKSLDQTASSDGVDKNMLGILESWAKVQPLSDDAKEALAKLRDMVRRRAFVTDARKSASRLDALVGGSECLPVIAGEAWADHAIKDINNLESESKTAWVGLLGHCATVKGSQPSGKWAKQAGELIKALGWDAFKSSLTAWLPLVDKPRTGPVENRPRYGPDPNIMLDPVNADILKGLIWCCVGCEDHAIARSIVPVALTSYKKVPGVGARAVSLGNACLHTLGSMPGMDGVAQLALLKVRVKFATAQKLIEKALTSTAQRLGLPRDEIEEIAVPSYGMEEVGIRRETIGETIAELAMHSDGKTNLSWFKMENGEPVGKAQKSVPAAIKTDFAEELKELKNAAKDIEKTLPVQRVRIDGLFLAQKSWPFDIWQQRYLDHPLVGTIARRLIWRFKREDQQVDAIWLDGKLVAQDDQPLVWLDSQTTVELWHPLGNDATVITAWRDWLERHQVRQPFKQAHREVYILTDAERNTRTYSNRFASHIIRQHQYNALCAARGWKNKLRLMVGDSYPPTTRLLSQWNLRAEFWVEGIGDEFGSDTNESGVFLRLATDQVRFYPIEAQQLHAHAGGGGYGSWGNQTADEPVPIDQIPPLVLSEIMRDVDLFVGVASVGNDPTWQDGGPQGRYVDYWQNYSFGDLSATAQTRKAVLEKLIPRLKIAPRCSFDDKFLVVRGEVRTYKIHLGSGNILMEPNDQYLCIVAARGAPAKGEDSGMFLPFEGDERLSIILSKALMLADDTKIKDSTIISQIGIRK